MGGMAGLGASLAALLPADAAIAELERCVREHGFRALEVGCTVQDLQQAMLAAARAQHGPDATLASADSDTFELLDLLYNEIEREVQHDAPAADMLVRLQVPVVQAALRDRNFFLRAQHPARDLLNTVAESGATWLGEEDVDPQLLQKLHQAVETVVEKYEGDETVFEDASREVQQHLQAGKTAWLIT